MPFVAEDGTGLTDANSLCSVEFADAYFSLRNVSSWTGTLNDKQAALVKATDYIETRFSSRFRSGPTNDDQALSWPRAGYAAIPTAINKATAEYALRALTQELAPDPVTSSVTAGQVTESTVIIGPITETTKYSAGSSVTSTSLRAYPAADMLLKPFFGSYGGVIRN